MQGIIMADAERMRKGKRGMIIAVAARDKYRLDGHWHWADEALPGQTADEVAHFDRHLTKVGAVVEVENVPGKRYGRIRIESITLVESTALTADQLRALGYDSLEEFTAAYPGYSNRRAWFVRFEPVKRWWEVWR